MSEQEAVAKEIVDESSGEDSKNERKARATRKTRKTKEAKASRNGQLLDAGQIRVLRVLGRSKNPMTRAMINEKCATVEKYPTAAKWPAWLSKPLGDVGEKARRRREKRTGHKTLLTLGYVRESVHMVDDVEERTCEITTSGRKALEAAKK